MNFAVPYIAIKLFVKMIGRSLLVVTINVIEMDRL